VDVEVGEISMEVDERLPGNGGWVDEVDRETELSLRRFCELIREARQMTRWISAHARNKYKVDVEVDQFSTEVDERLPGNGSEVEEVDQETELSRRRFCE
jgi:hypothetical protein